MSRSHHSLLLTLLACSCRGGHDSGSPSIEPTQTANASTSIVRLEHANATELAATLDEILEAQSRSLEGRWRGGSCALPHSGTEVEMWRELEKPLEFGVHVHADTRTNSLVLIAESQAETGALIDLIGRLDEAAAKPR